MTSPDIDAAARFLAASGRVLDRRRFERLFGMGDAQPVRDAITAYRNADGGFGHALEPDGRCPGSQPLAIEFALHTLHEADAWDDGLAQRACGWLDAHAPAEGGAVFVDPSIEGWPHAPWWVPEVGGPASLITTGLLAGTLHARGVRHRWLDRARDVLWTRISGLTTAGPYDMRAVLQFLDHVPDRDRAVKALDQLGPMILDQGMVTLDPEVPGEIHTPLDFAPLPGSLARGLFERSVIEAHLDHLASAQRDDGGWTFNWQPWNPVAAAEWRGSVTVGALCLLRGNGR
ncbi:MAG TPA: hypothetical protein VMV92_12155 [Streptosporangiaceae bacterium]|nr:hypothetical protein [Streptosporangiaceae bacterium]